MCCLVNKCVFNRSMWFVCAYISVYFSGTYTLGMHINLWGGGKRTGSMKVCIYGKCSSISACLRLGKKGGLIGIPCVITAYL